MFDKPIAITGFCICLMFFGCAGTGPYVVEGEVSEFDDKFSDTDMKMMAEEMAQSILRIPAIGGYEGIPTLAIDKIELKTQGEHINTEMITKKIMYALLNTGRLQFVDREIWDEISTELKLSQSGLMDQERAKKAKFIGADFLLTGELSSIVKVSGRTRMTFYSLSMRLTDVETTAIIWAGEKEIKKQHTQSINW